MHWLSSVLQSHSCQGGQGFMCYMCGPVGVDGTVRKYIILNGLRDVAAYRLTNPYNGDQGHLKSTVFVQYWLWCVG